MGRLFPLRRGVAEVARTSGKEATTGSVRHLLDWGSAPCPKGGLADRKEIVIKHVRETWREFGKVDIPAAIATLLVQWAERYPAPAQPLPVILKAFEDARHDADTRDGFELAHKMLLGRNATLLDEQRAKVGPIPDIIVRGAGLPRNRKRGAQPKPDRRKWLAIEVARVSWVTGLTPTRNETFEPDDDTPADDLRSAADLVARATGLSYRNVVRAWFKKIDGRPPSYLLERWERESEQRHALCC